jgi:hypothetical protein
LTGGLQRGNDKEKNGHCTKQEPGSYEAAMDRLTTLQGTLLLRCVSAGAPNENESKQVETLL